MLLLLLCHLVAAAPEVTDTVYLSDHTHGLPAGWQSYDNWSKPTLDAVTDGPLGASARVAFDDKSTVAHFDKGVFVTLPTPIPWSQVDLVSVRYQIDRPVANLRFIAHTDDGGWWDYTDANVTVGQPAVATAHKADFRLAWTDDPNKPRPPQVGRVLSVHVSVHNAKPVNSGEKFVLHVADLTLAGIVLPVAQPVQTDEPVSTCWPLAAGTIWATAVAIPVGGTTVQALLGTTIRFRVDRPGEDHVTINGTRVALRTEGAGSVGELDRAALALPGPVKLELGDASWTGRVVAVRTLSSGEALALSARTGAVQWQAAPGLQLAGDPPRLTLTTPRAWAGVERKQTLDADTTAGSHLARVVLASEPPVTLQTTVTLHDVDREAMQRAAAAADTQIQALAARLAAGRRETWWAKQPATTSPLVRDRERVDPKQWTQIKDPVTWQDLGGDFVGAVQCGLDEGDLKLYTEHYDFGRLIKPHMGYFNGKEWEANCRRAAERNLLVGSVWGYVPDEKWNGGFGDQTIPSAQHEAMLKILGRRFLGYEMGEQDGRYIGSYAPRYHPTTRAEGRELSDAWHRKITSAFHENMVALGSLNFSHQYGRLNQRMLGLETAQGLPSDIMEWSWLRGAAKQYGSLTWNCISVWNRFGYKSYTDTGPDHGPDKGTSLELMKRLWYVTWLYGSAANAFEGAYFLNDKDPAGFPKLSPVGQANVDGLKFAKDHRDRGVLYTPVALMLDKDCGWAPPRHLYTDARNLVWGNLPYGRGDYAADAFFRWIWPHYEDASYYPDERGFLTATPLGDQYDVILSDAPEECLRRYQTVVLLGDVTVDKARLTRFVAAGGELVTDADRGLGAELTGVAFAARLARAQRSVVCATGKSGVEEPYVYRPGRSQGATALALTESGDGLLWDHKVGRGRVITCAAQHYVAADTTDPQPGVDVPLRHRLLGAFQQVVGDYLRSLSLVQVDGPPLQVLVNVGKEPGRLIVTLVNHDRQPATATVTRRQGKFAQATPWLGQSELRDGAITATVPALDLVMVETR